MYSPSAEHKALKHHLRGSNATCHLHEGGMERGASGRVSSRVQVCVLCEHVHVFAPCNVSINAKCDEVCFKRPGFVQACTRRTCSTHARECNPVGQPAKVITRLPFYHTTLPGIVGARAILESLYGAEVFKRFVCCEGQTGYSFPVSASIPLTDLSPANISQKKIS